jgi:hypothetical protein
MAGAAGHVQACDWSRGLKYLNRWDPARGQFAGGFCFVRCGGAVWNTLRPPLPGGRAHALVFGAGYVEKRASQGSLELLERVEAPHGDDPVLLHTVRVRNTSDAPLEAVVAVYWGVNMHQVTVAPVLPKRLIGLVERWRGRFNRRFRIATAWDAEHRVLSAAYVYRGRKAPPPERRAFRDYHPRPVFLAALAPVPVECTDCFPDAGDFFGDGGLLSPRGMERPGGANPSSGGDGKALVFRHTLRLAAGEEVTLRHLYGCATGAESRDLAVRYAVTRPARRPLPAVDAPGLPWLAREARWHGYYIQAGSAHLDYFGAHTVDQGSAYSFLQGATGAPRDIALFILPMVYLRPDLAKDMLRFLFRSQRADTGAFPYAYTGHGVTSGAGLHSRSTDLDLFVFWALAEYLHATRDYAFLLAEEPYLPDARDSSGTVLHHVRAAFKHLVTRVGTGSHGLLRCGTGDWNDVLMAFSWLPPVTAWRGESSLNAGLATVALPPLAAAVEPHAPDLAVSMRDMAAEQARALERLWTGGWAARGYTGCSRRPLGVDRLFLDTQPFGVIGGVWTGERRRALFDSIRRLCAEPQGAGARCLWPPYRGMHLKPGVDTNGGAWAAIDAWVAWAWSLEDPLAAWRFYLSSTLAARTERWPGVWYGTWSGPDCYNAHYHARPGETSNFILTPMAEFPVFNMNRHAGPLTALIKMAGIEPRPGALCIEPRIPLESFTVRFPLVGVQYAPGQAGGRYCPVVPGRFRFAVRPPSGGVARLIVNGREHPWSLDTEGRAAFEVESEPGREITWTVTAP